MAKIIDGYNEIGFFRPRFNKVRRIGINPRYWIYRGNWWLVNKLHYVTRAPIHIDIESTNFCNLRCTMCPHSKDDFELTKGYFDYNLYKKIIKEISRSGVSSIRLNVFGEPLLHKRLVDMVALAKEIGILEVMFTTNGLLLTPTKSRELVEAGLDYLIVSIDGATKETYERIRVGGNFEALKENIEYFVQYRRTKGLAKPLIRLQFVEMQENKHERDQYLEMWRDKVDVMTCNRYVDRGCGEEKKAFGMVPKERANCYHPWRRMSINWQGDAQICCGDIKSLCVLGNVNDKTIQELWHGEKLSEYRNKLKARRLDQIPCCKDCPELSGYTWIKKE